MFVKNKASSTASTDRKTYKIKLIAKHFAHLLLWFTVNENTRHQRTGSVVFEHVKKQIN